MQMDFKNGIEEERSLLSCDVDFKGRWRPSAIFIAMQELAGRHCALLGVSREELVKRGIVWVLLRVKLDIKHYPSMGETVRIKTWTGTTNRALFPRFFSFEVNGKVLGSASSQWMLVDVDQHRMVLPSQYGIAVEAGGEPPISAPERLRYAFVPDRTVERCVSYSDIDVNCHMNNARYVEWILDLFPPARYEHNVMKTLQINYVAEAKPGEKIYLELTEQNADFHLRGVYEKSGMVVFEAAGQWTLKPDAQ